jgi:ElaB/YqjD/DUF883 family membrane-anchored ribosome-binding protein
MKELKEAKQSAKEAVNDTKEVIKDSLRPYGSVAAALSEYPEIEDIRSDLESLKTNVVELARHMKFEGSEKMNAIGKDMGRIAQKQMKNFQTVSKKEFDQVKSLVKRKPAQTLAAAFAAGVLISLFWGKGE